MFSRPAFRAARSYKHFLMNAAFATLLFTLSACGAKSGNGSDNKIAQNATKPRAPVCTTDRFQQPTNPVSNKVDILFVMDNSNSMNRHWQLMAKSIGKLIHALPAGQDIRFSVVLGTITKFPGVLFSDPAVPKVLDNKLLTEAQIMDGLTKTFAFAMKRDNIDWKGAGEALFYSLYYAVTGNAQAIQKQGFFRPDAALSVIFMSDDAEESYPYPSKQIWGLPSKCNWGHHETMRKTFYLPNHIDTDTTFAAMKRLKGDLPLLTSAFVNITKQDIMIDNDMNAHCIFDSPGFGYFDMVKRTNGLLYSIHQDRARGLELSGRMLRSRVELMHDFKLSNPADKVDPATIAATVDGKVEAHTFSPDTDVVHIDQSGSAGSLIAINYCEPVPQHEWTISGFAGTATQTAASLQWNTAEYPTTGKVVYGTSADALGASVADSVNGTTHAVSVSGLSPNTTYFFQVVADDEFGTEKKSEVITLRTRPDWTMSTLTGQASRSNVSLAWNTPEYPTSGVIAWGTDPAQLGNLSPSTAPLTSHMVAIGGLQPDTVYYFQARSLDEFGLAKLSNVLALRTTADWAIVGFAGQVSRTTGSFAWQTPEEVTTGQLRFGISADSLSNVVNDNATGNSHAVSLTGLTPGTTYYFQAEAMGEGREKFSPVLTFRTLNDWIIDTFSTMPTSDTISVSFSTTGYLTNGTVLWGATADQLSNTLDADANSNEHTAGITGLTPDTTYYVQGVAKDNLGVEKRTAVTPVHTKSAPLPAWVIAGFDGSTDTTSATLVWQTSDYPTTGKVFWGTSPDTLTNSSAENAASKTHSLTVNGLNPDTFYYFKVEASDDRGQTQSSSVLGLKTEALPLPAWDISNVSATPTQTTLAVTWSTSAYATVGFVKWGTSAGNLNQQTAAEAQAGTGHSIILSGLSPETTYCFQVVSTDDRGQVKLGPVVAAQTLAIPLPAWSISGLNTTPAQTTIAVNWNTSEYATIGKVRWGTTSGLLDHETSAESVAGNSHSITVSGLTPDTTYFIQAVSSDDRGQTKTSDIVPVHTQALPLPVWQITNFAGVGDVHTVALTWNTTAYATVGKVRWGTSADNLVNVSSAEGAASTTHAITVSGLDAGATYYFQAESSDDRGQVKDSAVIIVQTNSVPPTWTIVGFDGTTTTTTAGLIWQTPGKATKAVLKVGLSATDFSFRSVDVPDFATSHVITISGLTANTTYFFEIVASDADGGVLTSNVISKKTKTR